MHKLTFSTSTEALEFIVQYIDDSDLQRAHGSIEKAISLVAARDPQAALILAKILEQSRYNNYFEIDTSEL